MITDIYHSRRFGTQITTKHDYIPKMPPYRYELGCDLWDWLVACAAKNFASIEEICGRTLTRVDVSCHEAQWSFS